MKRCSRCGETKTAAEFYLRKDRPTPLSPACKACFKVRLYARRNADPDARRAYANAYYRKNAAKVFAMNTAWRKANWDRMRPFYAAAAAKRRALKFAATVGPINLVAIYARDGGRCWICWLTVPRSLVNFDHVIALSRGGEHSMDNLRTACQTCNKRKSDRIPTPALIARIGEEARRLAA